MSHFQSKTWCQWVAQMNVAYVPNPCNPRSWGHDKYVLQNPFFSPKITWGAPQNHKESEEFAFMLLKIRPTKLHSVEQLNHRIKLLSLLSIHVICLARPQKNMRWPDWAASSPQIGGPAKNRALLTVGHFKKKNSSHFVGFLEGLAKTEYPYMRVTWLRSWLS